MQGAWPTRSIQCAPCSAVVLSTWVSTFSIIGKHHSPNSRKESVGEETFFESDSSRTPSVGDSLS